jgi:hypothetical protein
MADASKYRMNPQVAKMHGDGGQRPDKGIHKPDPGEQEPKDGTHPDHVELHGKEPGPFKTLHHMGNGEPPEERHHNTLHEAHHAMNDHVGKDGCSGDGNCEHEPVNDEFNDAGEEAKPGDGPGAEIAQSGS